MPRGDDIVSRRLKFSGDEEAVDESAGGEAGAHGAERFEMADKTVAHFGGEGPKRSLFDDVQSQIPALSTMLVQDLALRDVQTA
jgi:hypothetical protein